MPRLRGSNVLRLLACLWAARVAWLGLVAVAAPGGMRSVRAESAWLVLAAGAALLALLGGRPRGEAVAPVQPGGEPRLWWLLPAGLVVSLLLYYPALGLGLLSDDFVLVDLVRSGRALDWHAREFFRPLPLLVWTPFTRSPGLLHAINLGLHGVNGFLVARLASALGLGQRASVAAGLLFLAFPGSVEAVGWCAGIQDLLMTASVLLSILSWTLLSSLTAALAVACGTLVAALASKETAVATAGLAGIAWLPLLQLARRRWLVLFSVGSGLILGYACWRIAATPVALDAMQGVSAYLLKEQIVRVFGALALPWHADSGVGTYLAPLTALGLPLLLAARALEWSRGEPGASLAQRMAVCVFLAVLPVWSMFFVDGRLSGSRYLYLPSAFWSILLAGLVLGGRPGGRSPRAWPVAALVVLIGAGAIGVRQHLVHWQAAAQVRDRTLEAAVRAADSRGCAAASFGALPDNEGGAYVFRNGFPQAIAEASAGRLQFTGSPSVGCVFVWDRAGSFRAPSAEPVR